MPPVAQNARVAARVATQLSRELLGGNAQGAPDMRVIDALVSELRACYPLFEYELFPGEGFVLKVPYDRMNRIPAGLSYTAFRIEALPGVSGAPREENGQPMTYVHKNRHGRTGWLTRAEIQATMAVGAALRAISELAVLQGRSTFERRSTWERLASDDEFGE